MKRLFYVFASVFLAMIAVFLISCQKTPDFPFTEVPEETKAEENPYSDIISDLPEKNFNGTQFRIATDLSSLFIPKNQSSVVGKELYLRNKAVEEKYNIKITLTDDSGLPTIADRVRSEALAGTDYCDMVLLKSASYKTLVSSNALLNVRAIPYLDLDADYYHSSSLTSSNFGKITYGLSGSFNYQPENCFVVFYNKDLLAKTALPSLHQLALDNQWDFDNFLLYSEEVFTACIAEGMKVNGFASSEDQQNLIKVFWAASGLDFLSNEYGQMPQMIYDTEETQVFIRTVQNILFRSAAYYKDTALSLTSFKNGETFLLIAPLSAASEITGYGVNWGVVPMPKLDINQPNYYTYLSADQSYVGFSVGTKNTELSGMVTNALFCASYGLMESLALKTYLNLYLNSPDDALHIQNAISTPYYDAAEFFSHDGSPYPASTQILLYRVLSSEGNFDTLYSQYQKMFQKYIDGKIKS